MQVVDFRCCFVASLLGQQYLKSVLFLVGDLSLNTCGVTLIMLLSIVECKWRSTSRAVSQISKTWTTGVCLLHPCQNVTQISVKEVFFYLKCFCNGCHCWAVSVLTVTWDIPCAVTWDKETGWLESSILGLLIFYTLTACMLLAYGNCVCVCVHVHGNI